MSQDKEEVKYDGVLENDEGFKKVMSLFKEQSYIQRLKEMIKGLSMAHDTKEYKEALTSLQRLKAPVIALLTPVVAILALLIFSSGKEKAVTIAEVTIQKPDELPDDPLDEVEEPDIEPPDVFEDFVPTDVDFVAQNIDVDIAANVSADMPVTAQPQSFDAVEPTRTPVILRGVYGSTRNPGARGVLLAKGGGNAKTEASVMRGLRWLKMQQNPDGSWPNNKVAMTGLAILTFLAHGEMPGQSAEFGETVQKGIEFLLASQGDKELYTTAGSGYAHAIATYAMCEAYGMTENPNVRESADRALDAIIRGQHPSGGWDYNWKQSDRDDTSVMGWAAQALKAAMLADFYHDPDALERASKFCVKGFKKNGYPDGGFGYVAPAKGGLTGVGVLCMQFHGAANDSYVKNSLENLIYDWKPAWIGSTPEKPEVKKDEPLPPGSVGGNCSQYYYYYATQAVFQAGGDRWKKWNENMWPSYVKAQFIIPKGATGDVCNCGVNNCKKIKEPYLDHERNEQEIGHWINVDAHGDRPIMDTCLACLQMMVYYRYLPTTAKINVPKEIEAVTTDSDDIEVITDL